MSKVVQNLDELHALSAIDGDIIYVSEEEEYYLYDEYSKEWLVYIEDYI